MTVTSNILIYSSEYVFDFGSRPFVHCQALTSSCIDCFMPTINLNWTEQTLSFNFYWQHFNLTNIRMNYFWEIPEQTVKVTTAPRSFWEMCLWRFPAVPGAVPLESIQGSAYEEKIILKWREPAQTYGIITQYEVQQTAALQIETFTLSSKKTHLHRSAHLQLKWPPLD